MRTTGAIVLCVFAALWGFLGLHLTGQAVGIQSLPIGLSFALALAALNSGRNAPPPTAEYRRRVGRTVAVWGVVEAVAIFAGVNWLNNNGHAQWTTALVATVVGLHFFPMAVGVRAPVYWLTGLGLLGVAAAGMVLVPAGVTQSAAIAMGCAVVLWLTALVITAFVPKGATAAA